MFDDFESLEDILSAGSKELERKAEAEAQEVATEAGASSITSFFEEQAAFDPAIFARDLLALAADGNTEEFSRLIGLIPELDFTEQTLLLGYLRSDAMPVHYLLVTTGCEKFVPLLASSAIITDTYVTAFSYKAACVAQDLVGLRKLSEAGVSYEPDFLVSAIDSGNLQIIDFFIQELKCSAQLSNNLPLRQACQNGNLEVAQHLIEKYEADFKAQANAAIKEARNSGNEALVEYLQMLGSADFVETVKKLPVSSTAKNPSRVPSSFVNSCLSMPVTAAQLDAAADEIRFAKERLQQHDSALWPLSSSELQHVNTILEITGYQLRREPAENLSFEYLDGSLIQSLREVYGINLRTGHLYAQQQDGEYISVNLRSEDPDVQVISRQECLEKLKKSQISKGLQR